MASNPFVAERLKKTAGFQDVPPTILASGELGIYYCNSEKLLEDGNEFKAYGEDVFGMQRHTLSMMDKNPNFKKVVEILAEQASGILPRRRTNCTISGGQTRDWLFSMPVAYLLRLPHISLFKQVAGQEDRIIDIDTDGHRCRINSWMAPCTNLHIVDLITKASSCYYKEADGRETGWIPMLRKIGANTTDLIAVVTRYQGGEKNLADIGVNVHAIVGIDADFLREHSKNPEAIAYSENDALWSENFLRENGASMFARFFDPSNAEKQTRAKRFVERYGDVLRDAGRFDELDGLVTKHYKLSVPQIMSGETLYSHTFVQKWREAVERKNSILCAGLDPADYWQAAENTLPEGADKMEWCFDFIEKIAPYAAAVKINGNFVEELPGDAKKALVDKIHEHGMVALWDRKLPDIGNTNDAGWYHSQNFGFDAVTYSPFPGNFEEVAIQGHSRGQGVIGMCIMSNPQHKTEKNKLVDITENPDGYHIEDIVEMEHPEFGPRKYVPQFIQLAHDAAAYKWDGVVIGAPSPGNHVSMQEVERIKAYTGDGIIPLVPGVGAQGGDAENIIKLFGIPIVNVGRAVLYNKDPAKAAMQYRDMLNAIREKYKAA